MAIVFSHGPGITPTETSLLRKTNQFLSITPESEMHCGHGHTYSHLAHDQASLGIDTHFAFSTDILTQARLWLQRTRSRLFDEVMNDWEIPATNPSMCYTKPISSGPPDTLILSMRIYVYIYTTYLVSNSNQNPLTDNLLSVRKPSLPPRNAPRSARAAPLRPRRHKGRRKSRPGRV